MNLRIINNSNNININEISEFVDNIRDIGSRGINYIQNVINNVSLETLSTGQITLLAAGIGAVVGGSLLLCNKYIKDQNKKIIAEYKTFNNKQLLEEVNKCAPIILKLEELSNNDNSLLFNKENKKKRKRMINKIVNSFIDLQEYIIDLNNDNSIVDYEDIINNNLFKGIMICMYIKRLSYNENLVYKHLECISSINDQYNKKIDLARNYFFE